MPVKNNQNLFWGKYSSSIQIDSFSSDGSLLLSIWLIHQQAYCEETCTRFSLATCI